MSLKDDLDNLFSLTVRRSQRFDYPITRSLQSMVNGCIGSVINSLFWCVIFAIKFRLLCF